MATSIVSNSTAATFGNSPQKTGEPVDRLKIYSGKALEFDGVSDRLEAGNAVRATTAFDGTNGLFTVAFWFKTSGSADGYIVDWSGTTYSTSLSILSKADGTIQARAAAFRIQTSASYNDGVWHYLVLTYDKSISDPNVNMYIDGELQTYATYTDTSSTANVNTSTSTGTIGCKFKSSTASAFFDGALSNFQVWKKAWAVGDVQYAYKNPERLITDNSSVTSGITTSDLELWYPMNDTGVRSPQSIVYDAANTGGLETNLVTSAGTEADWGTLTYGELTNTSATGFTFTSTSDGSENAYLSAAGLLSEDLSVGYYKISLDVTQTTPFGDEQSIRWYKTGSSAETLSLTAGSNVFYRPIDTANNNSQLFFNSNGAGNDITVSNFSIQKVKQGKHVTTTFTGDELLNSNKRDFTNSGGELRTGSVINSGAAKHHSYYEIVTQTNIDFTTYGAPDNYPGTVFCMNHADGSTVPTFDANNTAYAIDLGIATDYSGGDASSKFGIAPNGDNKIYNKGPELITNGTMEADSNWANAGSPTTNERSTTQAHSGTYSRKFTTDSAYDGIEGDTYTTVTGSVYSYNLWVYPDDGTAIQVKVRRGDNGGDIVLSTSALTQDQWNLISGTYTEIGGGSGAYITINSNTVTSGDYYVDDVSVRETDILSIEYVDQADGSTMYLDGSKSELMSESLVSGRQYTLSANYKVNTGSTTMLHYDGSTNTSVTLNSTSYADASITFTTNSATTDYVRFGASAGSSEITTFNSISLKEVGIATGWTDANEQPIIPQTSLMDGCVKLVGLENNSSNVSPHFTLDSTGTTASGTAYSVSAWLMRTTTPGATDNYLLSTTTSNDRIYFPSATQVGWITDGTGTTMSLGVTLEANVWEFWTFVSDGGTKRIYRNAQELVTSSQSPSNGFDYSHIGVYGASESASCFEGIIDELAIWDTVLSSTEVTELYNNGLSLNATRHSKYITSASNLKAYWKNNHLNSDGKIKDQVGSNHATITETGDSFEKIFFQQGITSGKCTQGFVNNIEHSSGGSLHLNGSSWAGSYEGNYAELPQDIDIEGDFSVEMWRKLTRKWQSNQDGYVLGANNTDFIVIPYGVSGGKLHQVYIRQQNGDNKTMTMDSSTDVGGSLAADKRPSVYEWFHVVLVRESSTYKVYVNGYDLNTGDREVGDSANDFTFRTIASMVGTGNQAQGFIDDLRIYDKALSIKEVTKNYNFGKSKHKNS